MRFSPARENSTPLPVDALTMSRMPASPDMERSLPQVSRFLLVRNFTGVPTAFAVLRGFSLFDNGGNLAFEGFGHVQDDRAIPQHVMVRITQVTGSTISGRCFCSESDETLQSDNTVLFSVVAIGRKV